MYSQQSLDDLLNAVTVYRQARKSFSSQIQLFNTRENLLRAAAEMEES